jgi:DNA-binding response OmpR family regulator
MTLDKQTRTIDVDNKKIKLSPKQFLLMELLILNKGKMVENKVIKEVVFDDILWDCLNDIRVLVCNTKKRIGVDIYNHYSKGYSI